MRRFLVLACLAVATVSQAIVIDDFTVPYTRTISTGTWVDYQTDPTLFTGERDVQMEILMDSSGPAELTIGNGMLTLVNSQLSRSTCFLQYDGVGDEINNTGEGKELISSSNPTNPFPAGATKVRTFVESSVLQTTIAVQLLRAGVVENQSSRTVLAGGPRVIDMDFHPAIMARCDSILFYAYVARQGSAISISRIEVVAEPHSGLLLAGGTLVAMGLRRRGPRT